jgi:cytoskeletal protein RodZ
MKESKEIVFKINTKKRNAVIAISVAVVVVIAGIITGAVIYHNNSGKTEIAEVATDTDAIVAGENETTEVAEVEKTEVTTEETETEETTETAKAEETTEADTTNETVLTGNNKPASNTKAASNKSSNSNETAGNNKSVDNSKSSTSDTKNTTHTHSYTSSVTTQPTCGQNGVLTYKCSCGDTYTESVAATGNHNYVQASCTSDTCSTCGATRSADHHNYEAHYATRTVETIVECDECNCGAWLRTHEDRKAHVGCGGYTNGAYYEETEEQYIDYYKCSVCGATK